MAVNAGSVYVDLGARLDKREFEAYEKQLNRVREQTQRREHFKAQLGADYDPRAMRAYESDLRRSERATDDHVKATGRLRTAFGSVWGRGGAALAAAGGAYGLVTAVKSVTNAYAESQVSQQKMSQQLKTLGISYDAHAKQIDEVIQRTSKLAGLDDEDLQDAFTAIVRTTKSVNTGLKDMSLVADLARAKHLDVARAGELVAKVHAGNVGALRRLGIEFTKSTEHVDKLKESTKNYTPQQLAAAKAQDKAADSTRAIGLLQQRFRGQADAYGKTQAGASDRVKTAWENLQETLGKKLAPTLTRAMNGVARFVNQMQDGTGAGGKFVAMLQRAARNFQIFGQHVEDDIHMISGWVTTASHAESTALHWMGTLVGGSAGRKLKQWGDNVDANRDTIDRWRQEMTIKREVDKIDADLDRLRNKTSGTLHGILTATHRNMAEIRKTMGTESAAGQKAIHDNFQAAVTAIRRAMRNGEISTKTGLAQIRRDMLGELKELGIPSALRGGLPLSKNPPKGDLPVTTNSVGVTKYGGGWIGMPGMVGPDVVPAMLAPGEAVLNRHQQAVIEGMLGEGFLDRLFATVSRPHYMQEGGRVRRFATGGLQPAVSRLANSLASRFGLTITSTTGGTHAPGSFHYQGLAADLGGPPGSMLAAADWIKSSGTYRSLLEGIHNPNLAVKNGQIFSGAGPFGEVWANHANHVHIALRALGAIAGGGGGGGLGAAVRAIRAPQVGGSGALHDIVQGVLTRTARGATSRVRALAASMGGGDITSQGVAQGAGADVVAAFRRAISSSAASPLERLALWEAGIVESGLRNLNFGDRDSLGALQERTSIYGRSHALDPFASAQRFLHQAIALRPFRGTAGQLAQAVQRSAFPGRYDAVAGQARQYMARGGRALPRGIGKATAGLVRKIRPLQTDRSSQWTALMARHDSADEEYARWERRFNITDEELVDSDTGQVNVAAVHRKAKELTQLLMIRAGMERDLDQAIAVARRVIASYRRVVGALRKSLGHARRKDRSGIRSYISTYETRIRDWQGRAQDAKDSKFDTHTDVLELRGELKDVLGTAPDLRDTAADTTGDTTGDTGADLGGGGAADIAPDTGTAAPTAADIAAGVFAQFQAFNQGRVDLLSQFGGNAISQRRAYMPGGPFSGSPDELTAAAGVRYFGATGGGSLGGLAGGTVVAHFASAPPDPPSFVQQVRFLVENGSG